ncbi:P-loop NTPase fold protein [Rhodovibrionaceae bacterium A322]
MDIKVAASQLTPESKGLTPELELRLQDEKNLGSSEPAPGAADFVPRSIESQFPQGEGAVKGFSSDQVDVGQDKGGAASSDLDVTQGPPKDLLPQAPDPGVLKDIPDAGPFATPASGLETWFNGVTGLNWSQGEIFQALGVLVLGLLVLFVLLRGPRRVAGEVAARKADLRASVGLKAEDPLGKKQSAGSASGPARKGADRKVKAQPAKVAAKTASSLKEKTPVPEEEQRPAIQDSIADRLISDRPLRPGDPDPLGYGAIARGISRFLRNKKTEPPLTLAIEGPWGSGKSSIMSLLKHDLERYGYHPVWFNAWHQTKEEHLLAALLEALRLEGFPPFWTRAGQGFRVRLFLRRLARHPGMVVTFVALLALQVGVLLAGFFLDAEEVKQVTGEWAILEERLASILPVTLAALVAAYNLFKALPKSLIDPAKLRAGLTRGFSISRYREQLSFRHRFAEEFQDVAAAMAPLRPVILIDDLDRCQPPEVLEVLTAVNFLVSSGACFAILGMDRERVLGCLGYGFKDIAAEMAADETTPLDQAFGKGVEVIYPAPAGMKTAPDLKTAQADGGFAVQGSSLDMEVADPLGPAASATSFHSRVGSEDPGLAEGTVGDETARKHRIAYARLYLEKLINIEVPVPQLGVGDAQKLLQSVARERPEEVKEPTRKTGLPPRRVLAAIALLCMGLAFGGTMLLLDQPSPDTVVASGSAGQGDPAQNTVDNSTGQSSVDQAAPVAPDRSDRQDGFNFFLPLLIIGGFAALGLAMAQLSRDYTRTLSRQQAQIADSQRFLQALDLWSPLLVQKLTTPRALKRFLNRLRYLAMLNRGEEGAEAGDPKLREDRLVAYAALNMVADDDLPLALARQQLVELESETDHTTAMAHKAMAHRGISVEDLDGLVADRALGSDAVERAQSSDDATEAENQDLAAFLHSHGAQQKDGTPGVDAASTGTWPGQKSRRAALLEGVGRLDNLKALSALQTLEGSPEAKALSQMVSRHEAQFEGELLVPEDVERFNAMAKGTLQ